MLVNMTEWQVESVDLQMTTSTSGDIDTEHDSYAPSLQFVSGYAWVLMQQCSY